MNDSSNDKSFNTQLDDILFDLGSTYDQKFGDPELLKSSKDNLKQLLASHLSEQGWYYYNPEELGEDAFEPLGKAEIKAALDG